jgi:hypothetical protein
MTVAYDGMYTTDESDDEEEERPRKRRAAERAAEGDAEDEEVHRILFVRIIYLMWPFIQINMLNTGAVTFM